MTCLDETRGFAQKRSSNIKGSDMKATEILKHEHQAILLVIAAVEKEVASIEKTGKTHVQTVREMADFLKNFVDRCHHGKEEKHLFVMMHERGMPLKAGPLATQDTGSAIRS